MKNLLETIALSAGKKLLTRTTVESIPPATIAGMNKWAIRLLGDSKAPFPHWAETSRDYTFGEGWSIPDDSWGRVWGYQRTCWLHGPNGVKSRWILGRTEPQEVVLGGGDPGVQ
ncbi:MAG: hypothetical protein AAF959_11345 [Cyanobacteria bacterium P01_D01_bin.56]